MPSLRAVGLMSGTSADGITAALVRIDEARAAVLDFRTFPYPTALRKRVLAAASLSAPELSRLNFELGEAFAAAARKILRGRRADVIGSHGQTVWHGPDAAPANTLQLGEPSVIAERTGIAVVADFRPRDMAAGGQGAPLVPAFDEFLFQKGPIRAVVNVGGVANVSIVGKGRLWSAFDTGPGNGLMDLAMTIATGKAMDRHGAIASRGEVDCAAVRAMLAHPYFKRPAPKSLDKNAFGEAFLRRHLGKPTRARLPGILATLNAFTACSIADALPRRPKVEEVVVSGGGAFNKTLMRNLETLLAPVPVTTTDRYGVPIMAKEAACFAWLAARAWQGKPNNCPAATGAAGKRILGKIVPA